MHRERINLEPINKNRDAETIRLSSIISEGLDRSAAEAEIGCSRSAGAKTKEDRQLGEHIYDVLKIYQSHATAEACQAHKALVLLHQPLIDTVIRGNKISCTHDLSDYDDLMQEGVIGLSLAAWRYDPTLGHKFSTFAYVWIKQRIFKSLDNSTRGLRIPSHIAQRARMLRGQTDGCGQKDRIDDLAEGYNFQFYNMPNIEEALEETHTDYTGKNNESVVRVSTGDPSYDLKKDDYETVEDRVILDKVFPTVKSLFNDPRREKYWTVLSMRYGLEDGQVRTLEEVGVELGVTRERIRQLEKKAFEIIRANPLATWQAGITDLSPRDKDTRRMKSAFRSIAVQQQSQHKECNVVVDDNPAKEVAWQSLRKRLGNYHALGTLLETVGLSPFAPEAIRYFGGIAVRQKDGTFTREPIPDMQDPNTAEEKIAQFQEIIEQAKLAAGVGAEQSWWSEYVLHQKVKEELERTTKEQK